MQFILTVIGVAALLGFAMLWGTAEANATHPINLGRRQRAVSYAVIDIVGLIALWVGEFVVGILIPLIFGLVIFVLIAVALHELIAYFKESKMFTEHAITGGLLIFWMITYGSFAWFNTEKRDAKTTENMAVGVLVVACLLVVSWFMKATVENIAFIWLGLICAFCANVITYLQKSVEDE